MPMVFLNRKYRKSNKVGENIGAKILMKSIPLIKEEVIHNHLWSWDPYKYDHSGSTLKTKYLGFSINQKMTKVLN